MKRIGWHQFGVPALLLCASMQPALAADPVQWFDVLRADVQQIDNLPASPAQPFEVNVMLDGQVHTLLLGPWSMRSDKFQVLTIGDDGIPTPYQMGPALTVRGGSLQDPTIVVAGSLLPEGLKVIVTRMNAEQTTWGIQPLNEADPRADRAQHVIYRGEDGTATGNCGNDNHDHLPGAQHDHNDGFGMNDGFGVMQNRNLLLTEIAHDADFQYYQLNGSSVTTTVNDIENVMAATSAIYERDTQVIFESTAHVVRTSLATNPYTSNGASTLLNQFRNHWLNNQQSIQRDVAHLWTGRSIDGSTIGIAYTIGGICTTSAYCLSQSRFTGNFNQRVALTVHELGHLYGAWHCNQNPHVSSPCNIMCSGLGGCNGLGLPNFGPQSVNFITAHAASRNCLDIVPTNLVPPIIDDFDLTAAPDPEIWESFVGPVVTSAAGVLHPSGTRSLRLTIVNDVKQSVTSLSATIDPSAPMFVGLWGQTRAANAGDAAIMEYFSTAQNAFVELFRFEAEENGTVDNLFTYKVAALPVDGTGSNAQFRIRNDGGLWYLDSMRIGDVPIHGLPFNDPADGDAISQAHWIVPTNAQAVNSSISLPAARLLRSIPIRGDYFASAGKPLYLSFSVQQNNPGSGMDLVAEVSNGPNWDELARVVPGGVGTAEQQTVEVLIPQVSQVSGMQIRFRTVGSLTTGSYLLNNVLVGDALPSVNPPVCLGDIADDFGFTAGEGGGPDGVVDFGDFVALLGLIGPCNGGTPGCLGDIADDFGFTAGEGGGPDGVVDFGDFVALLGLIGPCP